MERKKTNKKHQYIVSLVLHLWIFMGIIMAYSFATEEPYVNIFESTEPFITSILVIISFILVSETIVRLDFKSFRIVNRYSGTQYLVRRLIRDFFLNGAIFAIMFATELAPFSVPFMIFYYVLVTPLLFRFKQFTKK